MNELVPKESLINCNRFITAHIAGTGSRSTAILVWNDFNPVSFRIDRKLTALESKHSIEGFMEEYKIPLENVIVNSDGVGSNLIDALGCKSFNGSAKALHGAPFGSLKDQCVYEMKRVNNVYAILIDNFNMFTNAIGIANAFAMRGYFELLKQPFWLNEDAINAVESSTQAIELFKKIRL